jgi:SOS-response transcriptional repressor LexA
VPKHKLTERQEKVYLMICETVRQTGRFPTIRKIAEFVGTKSPNASRGYLHALMKKGLVEAFPGNGVMHYRIVGTTVQVPEIPVEMRASTVDNPA